MTMSLGLDVRVHEMVTLYVRGENVADEVYESVLGYPGHAALGRRRRAIRVRSAPLIRHRATPRRQALTMRRLLFQVHLWLGVWHRAVCCRRLRRPVRRSCSASTCSGRLIRSLFTPSAAGPLAEPVAVMESVSRAYPQHKLSGVDAPTTARPTYLAYVTSGAEFRTVLIDPVSTAVLGELPEHRAIRTSCRTCTTTCWPAARAAPSTALAHLDPRAVRNRPRDLVARRPRHLAPRPHRRLQPRRPASMVTVGTASRRWHLERGVHRAVGHHRAVVRVSRWVPRRS